MESLFSTDIKSIEGSLLAVLNALKCLRVALVKSEYELQDKIKEEFEKHHILFEKEYKLGPRNRVDFLVHPGIVVEVKRGLKKPNWSNVMQQLTRYASYDEVSSVILVVERNLTLPDKINGKPCFSFGLNKNWGIAL
ncbi:hypothetical protein ABEV55_08400 [Aneurinibacillus thermoaerophilus]|uniref:hypothetical protein n=1 Tax=Aneurinibacillus thermoaerophilus TaxID=143495 RepID=UPI002E200EF2|nr:hypothetical protein [Aneurinibacillus thermoaerophilus]